MNSSSQEHILNILTVGDGDLSYSLALLRAYHPWIHVTPTTLLSSAQELVQTYSNAADNIQELLQEYDAHVLYHVDATQLSTHVELSTKLGFYDFVMFNHPHLGDSALSSVLSRQQYLPKAQEAKHAQRHSMLLAHYFHSAKDMIRKPHGIIQVCLCGTQPETWQVDEMALLQGLVRTSTHSTTLAPSVYFMEYYLSLFAGSDSLKEKKKKKKKNTIPTRSHPTHAGYRNIFETPNRVQPHYPCPRKYRNGTLGSKSFLGKYGYRHRRTRGELYQGNESDIKVFESVVLSYTIMIPMESQIKCSEPMSNHHGKDGKHQDQSILSRKECSICRVCFETMEEYEKHVLHPALPDIIMMTSCTRQKKYDSQHKNPCVMQNDSTALKSSSIQTKSFVDELKFHPSNQDFHRDRRILRQVTIPLQYHQKRLKWCCRQEDFELSTHFTSRKYLEDAVKAGRIFLNGHVIYDNGRILNQGDLLTFFKEQDLQQKSQQSIMEWKDLSNHFSGMDLKPAEIDAHFFDAVNIIEILSRKDSKLVIAFKPVGYRSSGSFSPHTLEMTVKSMLESHLLISLKCSSMSLLDTGCAGLSVLSIYPMEEETHTYDDPTIIYTFTVLVHGSVPLNWDRGVFSKLSLNVRKFKRMVSVDTTDDEDGKIHVTCSEPAHLRESIHLKCQSRLEIPFEDGRETLHLSTISVQSSAERGKLCSVICYMLRKLGYPVVNDRFCKRELSLLPRVMRNILKDKLCIGCYSVQILDDAKGQTVSIDPHSRTQTTYWNHIMSRA